MSEKILDLKLCTDSNGKYTHIIINEIYEIRRNMNVYDPRLKNKRIYDYPSFIDSNQIQNVLRALWLSDDTTQVIETIPYSEVKVGDKIVFTQVNIGTKRYFENKAYKVIKINPDDVLAHRQRCWIIDERNRWNMVMKSGINKFHFIK